jgi:hypothetical protein
MQARALLLGAGAPRWSLVPQVADAHQAAAVHLQDSVSQRQSPVRGRGAAREQRLDVEPGGAQGRVLRGKRGLRLCGSQLPLSPTQAPRPAPWHPQTLPAVGQAHSSWSPWIPKESPEDQDGGTAGEVAQAQSLHWGLAWP